MPGPELGDVVPAAPARYSLPDPSALEVVVLTPSHRVAVQGPEATTVDVLSPSHRLVIISP